MTKRSTKSTFKIAFELKQLIEILDKTIFKHPIPVQIVSSKGGVLAQYVLERRGKEHYEVYMHPDEKIIKDVELEGSKYSQELLIGRAAHEVRHRVQHHFKISLLYDLLFEDEVKIKDPDLRDAVRYAEEFYDKLTSRGIDLVQVIGLANIKTEFDAIAIEKFVARKWRGNNLLEIAKIVRMSAKQLKRRESSFLFQKALLSLGKYLPRSKIHIA
ncbi:MAG: hypothetical protein QXP38_04135 [Nitrososphaerota archaeon]